MLVWKQTVGSSCVIT